MPASLIHFQPLGNKVESERGKTILDLARKAGVSIESICNSLGKCGKCRVVVRLGSASLSPPTTSEKNLFTEPDLKSGKRLACQARVGDADVVVEITQESHKAWLDENPDERKRSAG